MRGRFSRAAFVTCALLVGCCLMLAGCPNTIQGKLNQAEVLYANTAGELNDLREAGKIDAGTYHDTIAPSLKAAYAGIKQARSQIAAGNKSEIEVLLKSVNDALLNLQTYRPAQIATPPTKPSSLNGEPSIRSAPAPAPLQAMVDPVMISLAMGAALRLLGAAQTALKGDKLTPEQEQALRDASDAEAARTERLDADSVKQM